MILDWQKYVKSCAESDKLVFDPYLTKTGREYLRTLIAKYFIEKGKTDEEIKKWFKENDFQEFELYEDSFEDTILGIARACKWPKRRNWDFYITQKEIDYINNLECDLDCKKYLFGVLCCVKLNKIKTSLPVFNHSQHGYAWYLATGNYDFTDKRYLQTKIKKFMDSLKSQKIIFTVPFSKDVIRIGTKGNRHKVKITNTTLQAEWIDFEAQQGFKLKDNEEEIQIFVKEHIKKQYSVCPMCGHKFLQKKTAKTPLCKACYAKKRQNDKNGVSEKNS